jgi:tRNA-specific 2-thiouridylase
MCECLFWRYRETQNTSQKNNIPLAIYDASKEYIRVIKTPRYGYGKNMNPCVDCKIFMIQQAKKYAEQIGADIIFTGEVSGQRPMSQLQESMNTIAHQTGLEGKLLRPLSAQLLAPTEAENKGWVQREKLFNIHGRGRKRQLELAHQYNIVDYETPSGGCLLTETLYSQKLKDLLHIRKRISLDDIQLLKMGRYFRDKQSIIVVGKNENDNNNIQKAKKTSDWIFEIKEYPGPTTLVRGPKTTHAIYSAAALTARYSQAPNNQSVTITYGKQQENSMDITVPSEQDCKKLTQELHIG